MPDAAPSASTLVELMDIDPLKHTDQDIDAIVAGYRETKHKYALGDVKAGTVKPKAPAKALSGLEGTALADLMSSIKL